MHTYTIFRLAADKDNKY